ncbi:NUDIX domain-containing protein [Pseudomonas sp. NA-150]|uniref:NUDIX hydrolase n=1 Tax=Pseudomonas sp. NA-150 TaxID=3367525 RepID=UPI0037C9DACD
MAKSPRLGCGAAIIQDGKILLIQRLNDPESGCWGLPGGKVDFLELVEHAVKREIAEELGIQLFNLVLLCVVDQIDLENNEHWVAPVYQTSDFDGIPYLVETDKHSGMSWYSLDAVPERLTVATRAALPLLREQLS